MTDPDAMMRGFLAFKHGQLPDPTRKPSPETLVFGTAPDCDVRIDDPYVSLRHARAWRDEQGRYWIEDLGSTNGTYVQHVGWPRVQVRGPHQLLAGDTIWFGTRTSLPWKAS